MESCPIPAIQARYRARQNAHIDPEYQYFTEIVRKSTNNITPSYALQCWLRDRNTLRLLLHWERDRNPSFIEDQAEALIAESTRTNTSVTPKKWIERTNATGIVSLPGRYGGTYAAPIIATAFGMWLLPEKFCAVARAYCCKQ